MTSGVEEHDASTLEGRIADAFMAGERLAPTDGGGTGAQSDRPLVRASWLTEILDRYDPAVRSMRTVALRLAGVRVTGVLDLREAALPDVDFEDCDFDDEVLLYGSQARSLTLENCRIPALAAHAAEVSRDLTITNGNLGYLDLSSVFVRGVLNLSGTAIGSGLTGEGLNAADMRVGRIVCQSTTISGPAYFTDAVVERLAVFDDSAFAAGAEPGEVDIGEALIADGMTVGGALTFRGCRVNGLLGLAGIRVANMLDMTKLEVNAYTEIAINLRRARIEGDMDLSDARISGSLHLPDATVGGTLALIGANIGALLGSSAVQAERSIVSADFHARDMAVEGDIVLSDMRVGGAIILSGSSIRSQLFL